MRAIGIDVGNTILRIDFLSGFALLDSLLVDGFGNLPEGDMSSEEMIEGDNVEEKDDRDKYSKQYHRDGKSDNTGIDEEYSNTHQDEEHTGRNNYLGASDSALISDFLTLRSIGGLLDSELLKRLLISAKKED